ncbi:MAG TPA: M18 family aminopeptidase [Acidimicrobiales bacterium]|nr:M18 family aminopeptidase [Acidimicrobiales bacterium]
MADLGADIEAAHDLLAFVQESPTPFHACVSAAARLDAVGFTRLDESSEWPEGPDQRHYLVRDGSLIAWTVPSPAVATTPFRIIGAHTDSPNLRIKPHPDVERAGVQLLAAEVYGGALFNSWLDRDLGIAGRVALRGGALELLKIDRPMARIPQLAIHLDREVNTKGLVLNPQQHLVPVWSTGSAEPDAFRRLLACELGVEADDVLFWDVMFHDVEPGTLLGRDDEFISAPRLDNLASCWAAVHAISSNARAVKEAIQVIVLFDHEEIGSTTNRGAASSLLDTTLERITRGLGGDRDAWHRAVAGSICLSADMAHATHPNYPERHEPGHWIALGGGPVVKTNASQRYATDARSAAVFIEACDRAGVTLQHYVHRGDLPCGSTIGPITAARLGIATVDVGAPQLSMHSARELMATDDAASYRAALTAFFT